MANTANVTALTTDFNVTPYYDDYDPNKGYYRILFKPGYAVQARELTQMQTTLQEQIQRFGRNIFKDGTIVIPGAFYLETNAGLTAGRAARYVKVLDNDASGNPVNMTQWKNFIYQGKQAGNTRVQLRSSTSNITAQLIQTLDGVQSSSNTKTIYVAYTSASSANATQKVFQAGETLTANVNNTNYTLVVHNTDPAPTGFACRFAISSGVIFAKNHFIAFPDSEIIVSRYNANPTARVGFYISEEIVNASGDSSLLDPAQEASNFSAPGSDRLRLNPELAVVGANDTVDVQNFVTLFTMENGVATSFLANTQYSYINDAMARRTYDNSGDYVVNGMEVQIKEHDDTGSNFGRYENGNNSQLYVGVSPGVGYCEGFQVGSLATVDLSVDKGLTTSNVNAQLVGFTPGSYVTVDEFVGGWELNKGNSIDLYNAAQNRISEKKWSIAAQSGSKIGSATILSYEYVSGTPGYDAKYNIYLSDVKMLGSNVFSSVRSLYAPAAGVNPAPGADAVLSVAGNAVLQKLPDAPLLYYTGSDYTKTIRSVSDTNSTDTNYRYSKTEGVSSSIEVKSNGVFTLTLSPGSESFVPGSYSGSSARDYYLTFNQSTAGANVIAISMTGFTSSNTGKTLTGLGTKFTRLNVGDKIQIAGNTRFFYVTSINSDTSLTVDADLPAVLTGNALSKVYKSGDMINMSGVGNDNGLQRTITATSTSLQFNLRESFPSTFYVTVTYPVARSTALEIKKTLNTGRYVKIRPGTNAAGLRGPFDLGFSDVYKIKSIRSSTGSYPASNTAGTNVISAFEFNNGQKDTLYDHATIKPKSTLTSDTYLLVELDYFTPDFTSGSGYFSIDSYPIQDNDALFNSSTNIRTENVPIYKSPTTGKTFDLRNYLDFRPVKTNSASNASTPAAASINPTASSTYQASGGGLKFPVTSSVITFDYYYYLGRTDLVVVDKNNKFQIIKGVPGLNPKTPEMLPGTMALASLKIVPYPSLSPAYAIVLDREDLACSSRRLSNIRFTMRDIGVLKERIVNLEYYTSLSVLERAATTMKVLDENGLDRFKNGIFTDNFRDSSLSATYDKQQRITFDPEEKSIRPLYKMESIAYDYRGGTNVKLNNPVITLDYSEILHYAQVRVTADINVERQSWLFLGTVNLYPEQDIWIDTTIMPDEQLSNKSTSIVVYGTQGKVTRYATDQSITDIVTLENGQVVNATTNLGTFKEDSTPGVDDVLVNTTWNAWKRWVTGYKVYTGTGTGRTLVGTYSTYDAARAAANSNNPIGGPGVTIETVYNNQRTGSQYWESNSADVVQTGYKIVDIQSYPYIRQQTITVRCTGMKPFTQMWPYFDSVPMANNSRPITANQFGWTIANQPGLPANTQIDLRTGTSSNNGVVAPPSSLGTWSDLGNALVTDADGNITFQMQIPKGQFRVGQRPVLVIDSRTPIDPNAVRNRSDIPEDISTGGQALFTASGTAVTKQRSILTTKTVSYHTEAVTQDAASSEYESIAAPPPPPPASHSCSAYSFLARAPKGEEGIFLTSVDLFVSRIGRQGFWVEIREMDAGQQITRNTVPYSEVFFNNPATVPISPNGKDNPCKVVFPAPVFLYNDTQYAFVIHPINANPDLYLWISRLGQTDINGLGPVIDRRGTGTFYQTNNNTNWDIIPDVDLAVKFYRADFVKDVDGVAYLGNLPIDKLYVKNQSITFEKNYGEPFISGDKLTLSGANGTISVGDVIAGKTSFQNSTVVSVSGGLVHCSNTGYFDGEIINVLHSANLLYKGVTATISDKYNAYGTLSYYSDGPDTSLVYLSGSGGGFVNGDYVISATDWSKYGRLERLESISKFRYSTLSFEPSFLSFQLTDINFKIRPLSVTGTFGSYIDIDPSETFHFKTDQAIFSKSLEISELSGQRSMNVQVNMRTASNAVSPLVDVSRTHCVLIDNIINNETIGESLPTHGALINKYISKTVTLAEGQDAEDMHVILTAYRPPGTDVKVWLKVLNAEDDTPVSERPWIELYKQSPGDVKYSSIDNLDDFIEYTYLVPSSTVDRLTLNNTLINTVAANQTSIIPGNRLDGLTSGFYSTVQSIEGNTIFVMSASGFAAGESANVVNTATGNVVGNTVITTLGRPAALVGGVSNVLSYTTDSGVTYQTYKYFAIKVGLLNDGENSAVVPRVGDLRAIALQK